MVEGMMKLQRLILILMLIAGVQVFAACDEAGNENTNTAANTTGALTQTYSDAGLTFKYPEDWVAAAMVGEGAVAANSQEVLELVQTSGTQMPDGGQAVLVLSVPAPGDAGIDAAALLQTFAEGSGITDVGEVQDFSAGNRSGVMLLAHDANTDSDGSFYVFQVGESVFGIVTAVSKSGTYDDALIRQIVETVDYSAPTTDE
jgi:hypothetical protein